MEIDRISSVMTDGYSDIFCNCLTDMNKALDNFNLKPLLG